MRILHFVGYFPSLSETFVANQIAGAIRRGHDVWVYAVYGSTPDSPTVEPLLASRVLRGATVPHDIGSRIASGGRLFAGLARGDLGCAMRLVNVFRYGWDAASLKLLHRAAPLAHLGRFDVIHCQFGTLAPLVLALRREQILEGPVVVNFRGHDISAAVSGRRAHIYDSVFGDADFFVTNCMHFRQRLELLGCEPSRLSIVYSGIDTGSIAYRSPRENADRLHLIAIGRLVEKKGFAYAIAAAALLRDRGLDFKLDIVGNGPLEPALRSQVAELGLEDRIAFLGGLPHRKVLDLLRESDAMISPNVTAGDGDEDAPVNTIKEAMAIGVPVVSTRHGGIPELIQDGITGLLSGERDVEALAAHVVSLSSSVALRRRLSAAARAFVEQEFELELQNDRLMRAYEQAIEIYARRAPKAPSAPSSPVYPTPQLTPSEPG